MKESLAVTTKLAKLSPSEVQVVQRFCEQVLDRLPEVWEPHWGLRSRDVKRVVSQGVL